MAEVADNRKYLITDEMMKYLKSQENIFGKIPECPRCGTSLIGSFFVQHAVWEMELSVKFVCGCKVTISVPHHSLCRVQTERREDARKVEGNA